MSQAFDKKQTNHEERKGCLMNKQQGLTPAELEVTQKIQTHFPRGLNAKMLGSANSCPAQNLTVAIEEMLNQLAKGTKTTISKLLQFICSIEVSAATEFIAAEHFKVGTMVDGVMISQSMGDNFKEHFLPKIEKGVAKATVRVHKLLSDSRDIPIITELGGEDVAESSLAHLWQLLKFQGKGEEGALLVNDWANIFYIGDINSNLWAVSAYWCHGGWFLYALSVEYPSPWYAGRQVCSR
jgi:hypothetical protein